MGRNIIYGQGRTGRSTEEIIESIQSGFGLDKEYREIEGAITEKIIDFDGALYPPSRMTNNYELFSQNNNPGYWLFAMSRVGDGLLDLPTTPNSIMGLGLIVVPPFLLDSDLYPENGWLNLTLSLRNNFIIMISTK